ncbi:MAG: hypothetical protein WCY82_10785, partial [Desulfotomaculaceae bacterium]
NKWRFLFEADEDAKVSKMYGTNTSPSCYGEYLMEYKYDGVGRRVFAPFLPGVTNQPSVEIDWGVFYQTAPSIRLDRAGEHHVQLPVKKGVQTTVRVWARHNKTNAGVHLRRSIINDDGGDIAHPPQNTPANTWFQLSLSFSPDIDDLIDVYFGNTNDGVTAWFSDPVVT